MLANGVKRKAVEALHARLEALENESNPQTPLGDVGWLKLRCQDTLGMHGGDEYWCNLSFVQLKKDVAEFCEEFPGVLDPDLVATLDSVPVRA